MRKTYPVAMAMLLLTLILVGCGGTAVDPTPANEQVGPGLFSGESGMFRILGKPDSKEEEQNKN